MPKVTIRDTKTLPRYEVKRAFRELAENFDPEQSVAEVLERLHGFEQEFGMSTVEFYWQYLAGKMGDDAKAMIWAGTYENYEELMRTYFRPKAGRNR